MNDPYVGFWRMEVAKVTAERDDARRQRDAARTELERLREAQDVTSAQDDIDWRPSPARSPQGEDHEAGIPCKRCRQTGIVQGVNTPGQFACHICGGSGWVPQGEDHKVGRIVKFLADAGETSAAAIVEIEFGQERAEP